MADTDPLKDLAPHAGDTKLSTPMGIAAIALSLAMKYHDINTVQDGALYQQYKLEGRNLRELNLDQVFETAIRIELHLLAGEKRISELIMDAIVEAVNTPDEPDHG